MDDATFTCPDLTTFCRLDELGLVITGQRIDPDRAVLACRVVEPDQWCRRCGAGGVPRDTVRRRLAHEPLGWRPTTLLVTIRRYRCDECGHVWRQDTEKAAGDDQLRAFPAALVPAHLMIPSGTFHPNLVLRTRDVTCPDDGGVALGYAALLT